MPQRPTIKQPTPLASAPQAHPLAPNQLPATAPSTAQMLGELKAEVSPEAAPLWQFVLDHANVLATAVLAIVLLIAGVGAWQWYQESSVEKAALELGRISATRSPQARVTALEAFAPNAPKAIQAAVQLELASAAAQAEDWAKATTAYAAVANAEGDSPLGFVARMNEADLLMRQGKPADALALLEALLPKSPEDLRGALNSQIAESAEAAGQKEKAIAAYTAAMENLKATSPEEYAFYQTRITALQQ